MSQQLNRKYFQIIFLMSLLLFSQLVFSSESYKPTDKEKAKVVKFVSKWLSNIDEGNYKKANKYREQKLKEIVPYDQWVSELDDFKLESGKVLNRSVEKVHWQNDPPNTPTPGVYVIAEVYGKFEKINKYREIITLLKSGKNNYRVIRREKDFLDKETEKSILEARAKRKGRRFQSPKISEQDWQQYYLEILALSGWRGEQKAGQIVFNNLGDRALYVFTTIRHPAHPAVVKRYVVEADGGIHIGMHGYFAGLQSEFDQWWKQFEQLNEQARQAAQRNIGQTDGTTTQ